MPDAATAREISVWSEISRAGIHPVFNTYEPRNKGGLVRTYVTEVDLRTLPLSEWRPEELGLRLASIYGQVDGRNHETASPEVIAEVETLMAEIRSRGFEPSDNLIYNERFTGWGWLAWPYDKEDNL